MEWIGCGTIDLKKTIEVADIDLNGKVISPQYNADHDHNGKSIKGIKTNKKHELKKYLRELNGLITAIRHHMDLMAMV